MKNDETHLTALINHINTSMTYPFDVKKHPSCLMKISKGFHTSPEVEKSLIGAEKHINGDICWSYPVIWQRQKPLLCHVQIWGYRISGYEEEGNN